jgi:hypothetical protein
MVDLGSANGTLLNGEYTDQAVLEHDDELVIGRTMLIFQCPEGRLAEPPEKGPEEENITDDVGPEVMRNVGRTERPQVVEMPPPSMPPPSMPPPSMPPPSMNAPAVAPQMRVVKGQMERPPSRSDLSSRSAPRVEPPRMEQEPSDDLFAEDPTPHRTNLFAQANTNEESPRDLFEPQRPDRRNDLFQETKTRDPHEDLFQEDPTPPSARRQADLFVPPSAALDQSDEDTVGSDGGFGSEDVAPEVMIHEERSADLPELEPVEIIPNDPLYEPMAPPSTRALEGIPDERTVSEQPATMSPDYEPSDPAIPAFTDWDGVTNDDVLLANQPVIAEVEVPDIEEYRPPPPKKDDDAATLMVSRNDLFADDPPAKEDLVRWGDERPIMESHPEFAASEKQLDGESMPVANHSLVNLPAQSRPGRAAAEDARQSFHQTLAALRERAERADLPDREQLLSAIDLLEHHAYVRVALAMIEREER